MNINAMNQALEAIQDLRGYRPDIDKAIEALRTAIQQAESAEAQTKTDEPVNPTHWRAVLSEPQRPHELRKHLHTVLFREWDDAESWVASKLDFEGWQYTLEPLYTHPAPGVPDGWSIEEKGGDLIVRKNGFGGYSARKNTESIAEAVLHELALDLLAAEGK